MSRINKKISVLVIAMILMLGIGFAAITTTLTITGNTGITGDSSNFQNNVFFASASLTATGLRTEDTTAAKAKINGKEMNFTIPSTSALKVVGDKIEVDYTIRNESNYKALIAVPTVTSSSTDFLDYFTVTHSRTTNLELGVDETSSSQKLTLTLKKTYADTDVKNFTFKVGINATAIGSNFNGDGGNLGVPEKTYSFATDDWETIVEEVVSGNFIGHYPYNVGDTRLVDLGEYGTHMLRVVNTSSPSDCDRNDYSQTACGFVVEFADIITKRSIADSIENSTLWSYTDMRTFLNNRIFNALPEYLRYFIDDTRVVVGDSLNDNEFNYVSTDKLYLLSATEVWGYDTRDIGRDYSRQLDYYSDNGLSLNNNFNFAIKQYNGDDSFWTLRSVEYPMGSYHIVTRDGFLSGVSPFESEGVSPAFRIGKS